MVDPRQKSKRRSSGEQAGPSGKEKNRTFYLDENFDCPEVKELLDRHGVRYRIYKQDTVSGAEDRTFLPKVGERGWLLITADWHQRTRPREAEDMRRYGVK